MEYTLFSFRNAQVIFENDDRYTQHWHEMLSALDSINDSDIIEKYNANPRASQKSISDAINILIDERLVEMGWDRQSPIFNDSEYRPNSQGHWWTLDFVKGEISVEVAFNHVLVHSSSNPWIRSASTGVRIRSRPVPGSAITCVLRLRLDSEVNIVLAGTSKPSGKEIAPSLKVYS